MTDGWTEDTSATFRNLAHYAVPEREIQIDTIVALIPEPGGPAAVMDICCGEGRLTTALLERFPTLKVLAYDGSPSMLTATRANAGIHAERVETQVIDIAKTDWRRPEAPLHAVVSSLAIHHLNGPDKRTLFAAIAAALKPGGVFVLADLVEPATSRSQAVAADAWDAETRRRALDTDGTLAGFDRFIAEGWNHYRLTEPDPIDQPSRLVDMLDWLRAVSFTDVDVHWMKAGHVILSGSKP